MKQSDWVTGEHVFKEKEIFVHKLMFVIDVFVLALIFVLTLALRTHLRSFYNFDIFPATSVIRDFSIYQDIYIALMLILVSLWALSLYWSGMYRSMLIKTTLDIAGIVIKSAFVTAITFSSLSFMLRIEYISRAFFVMFMVLASIALILEKSVVYSLIGYTRRRGYNHRRLLVVGTGKRAEQFIRKIRLHPEWGLKIVGILDYEHENICAEFEDIEIMGTLKDMEDVLRRKSIDEVIFIIPRSKLAEIENYLYACETVGVKCTVAVDLFHLKIARLASTEFDGMPMITFETTSSKEWQLFLKRVFDLAVSGSAIIILSPVMIAVAILIKIVSPGPVLYRQKRLGLNGRRFVFLKFRSMHKSADLQLASLISKNESTGPTFKIKNDPRVYPFGKFLRKFSIDELPQLFNVFFGQMSLVGPRPPIFREVKKYEPWQRRRLSMRPGITCLWQVSGRNRLTFTEWMKLDLQYIDNWSLWLDFNILARTIPAVLFGRGAS